MADIEIREMHPEEAPAAAAVLSRGMRDNPVHVPVFGADPDVRRQQLERFFGILLRWMSHPPWVGIRDRSIVAVWGMAAPGECKPTLPQMLIVMPLLVPQVVVVCGAGTTVRAVRWLGEWGARDPKEAHWHLGPVGVDAHLQGRGIGSQLMGAWCAHLDEQRAAGYLETDKPENVRFYSKFGFATVAEADVLGTRNWFMARAAR